MKNLKNILSLLIVLVMLLSALSVVSVSAADYTLTTKSPVVVTLKEDDNSADISFTPDSDGIYHFYSTGTYDTFGSLYDSDNVEIAYNDEGKDYQNFGLSAYLYKGKTYTLEVLEFDEGARKFSVFAEKADADIYETEISPAEYYYIPFTPSYNGYYAFYSVGDVDTVATLYDRNWDYLWDNDDYHDSNFKVNNYLYSGRTYYLEVSTYSEETEKVIIAVEETVVPTEVEVIRYPDNVSVIEGYEYETRSFSGMELEFTMSDGSHYLWGYGKAGLLNGCDVWYYSDYDDYGDYYTKFYSEYANDAYIWHTVIPNPVKSIEYPDEFITLIEGANTYTDTDENDVEYTAYNYSIYNKNIVINYKDGTSETVKLDDIYDIVYVSDNQSAEYSWTKTSENYIQIDYLGATTKIPVKIIETPVKSITVNKTPDYKYILSPEMAAYNPDEGVYYIYPYHGKGLEITVTYKDGTTETVKIEDELYNIEDFEISHNPIVVTSPGIYTAEISYKGYSFEFDIECVSKYYTPPAATGLLGDANEDSEVSIKDATLIQKKLADLATITETGTYLADVDGNDEITIKDATAIQKHLANITTNFPIGEPV